MTVYQCNNTFGVRLKDEVTKKCSDSFFISQLLCSDVFSNVYHTTKPVPDDSSHLVDGDVLLVAGVDLAALDVRVGRPDEEAQTLDERTVVGTVTPDDLVARWDAEVLPSHACRTAFHVLGNLGVPDAGKDNCANVINDAQALNVATSVVLADVDVRNFSLPVQAQALVALFVGLESLDVRRREVLSEVEPHAEQIG